MTKVEKQYAEYEKGCEYVWGAASIKDPLVSESGSLWIMYDITVIHHTDTDEYSVELNGVPPQERTPKQYIGDLMDKFREWMISTGRDTNYPVNTYDLFITGANINTRYGSIEELYASFEKLATNYIDSNTIG